MSLRLLVIGALLLGPALASGEALRTIRPHGTARMYELVGKERADGLVLARQVIPAPTDTPDVAAASDQVAAVAQSRVIYLNKNGVTLSPGENDARANRSTVVRQLTAIPAWDVGSDTWQQVVSCMRDLFSAYDVRVVDVDPGNVPHIEAVFGGSPSMVNMDFNVIGVSPFTTDCAVIENSVVFTFTGAFALSAREACEVMAQEVAHSYGLDHELLASDPMTYLEYEGERTFKNQSAQCGEEVTSPRACGINGNVCRETQNSVKLLEERLGLAPQVAQPMPAGDEEIPVDVYGGCAASDSSGSSALVGLGLAALFTARRRRR